MIVKSFIADSVAGALKMVRSELGGDAVILKTRKINPTRRVSPSGRIEVTACVDQSQPATTPAVLEKKVPPVVPSSKMSMPSEVIAQKLDFLIDVFQTPVRKNAFSGVTGRLFTALLKADVPESMAYDLAGKLSDRSGDLDDFHEVAVRAAKMILDQLPQMRDGELFMPGQRIVLVGPPGAGKTSLIGRLAAYLISRKNIPACLTSLDRVKVSAPDELQTYADILNVDHFEMPLDFDQSILERRGQEKVTLIDMPALNPKHREHIKVYNEKLSRIKPHRIIGVFPALYRSSDLFDIIRAFKPFRLTDLAFTMTDQTERLGGMVAMSIQTGLPITILGTGQKAADIDVAPDHQRIIQIFLGLEEGRNDE
jgi:flagellar biosynthesis protein FlhF